MAVTIAASVVLDLLAISAAALQQPARMYRIGVLTVESAETLRQSLRDLGYVEGRNVILEIRDTAGTAKGVNDLASELTRLKVDVIVDSGCRLQRQARDGNDSDRHGAHA